jgi:S-adenosylmethionine hydrolase
MVITLTTDFGYRDYFVGSMKGIILGINPQCQIVDISHEVEPYSVETAAYLIKSSYLYFPPGTIHVVVVDPEVGGTRRPILVEADQNYYVGPDNGVFSYIYEETKKIRVIHVTAEEYILKPNREAMLGQTFHGRDVFAPVGAWLSKGISPVKFGQEILDPIRLPLAEPRSGDEGILEGKIIYVDRFGNLISNITRSHFSLCNTPPGEVEFQVLLKGQRLLLKRYYAEGNRQEPCALINSCGHLEIFVYLGNAKQQLRASIGDPVLLIRSGKN